MKKIFTLVAAALCSMSMMAKEYTCPLVVNMMGTDMPVGDVKVNVDEQGEGKYTMSLLNFKMNDFMQIGNIVIKDVEATKCGNVIMLNAAKDIQITEGDDKNVEWMGPGLGNVNIIFKGELKGNNFNAYLNIPLAGGMIVGVKLGEKCNEMGQLPNAGFEKFHEASYNDAKSQEPNVGTGTDGLQLEVVDIQILVVAFNLQLAGFIKLICNVLTIHVNLRCA